MSIIGICVFVAACAFFAFCLVVPITSEPGKDGWDDVND